MNSSRQIAGFITDDDVFQRRAFFQEDGETTNLGVLPGDLYSEAVGISESGIVCATSYNPLGGSRAFVWQDGVTTILNIPMGPYAVAFDISDTHLVCGWMGEADTTVSHGFTHDLSTGTTLDMGVPLTSIINSHATGVNSQGNVCGWGFQPCVPSCGLRRGFFWSDGKATDLGMLPNLNRCTPNDLNDSNVVVGLCTSQTDTRGFVWQNGAMHDLNELVPEQLNLWIQNATAINNAGQIAVYGKILNGGPYVALRLNPVPPLFGDITCDWNVNALDILEVIRYWGQCPPTPEDPTQAPPFAPPLCPADLNNDNRVGVPDLLSVINHWGQGQGLP